MGEQGAAGDVVVLDASRGKWGWVLVGSFLFLALGLGMLISGTSPIAGAVTVAIFGFTTFVAARQFASPGRLVITATTFEVQGRTRTLTRDLATCSEFSVWQAPPSTRQMVVFDHPDDAATEHGAANRELVGHSASLPDLYGLPAGVLAEILNQARERALGDT